jgi:hypothetical protein
MPKGIHNNHRGGGLTNPAKPLKTRVELEPDQAKRMTKLLTECVEEGLNFAKAVLKSKEQVEIIRFTREGIREKLKMDKYSPELKVKLTEILIGKVFAEKKDIGVEPDDPNALQVVGFKFVPVEKKDNEQNNLIGGL